MFEPLLLSGGKRSIALHTPLLNGAGTLGFAAEAAELLRLDRLGAFVTNPISRRRRSPATDSGAVEYHGGLLLHSGHPNPGLTTALRHYLRPWTQMSIPVIVHLLADHPQDYESMILEIENEPALAAVEIGLQTADLASIDQFGRLGGSAELPVILRLPLDAPAEAFQRAAVNGAAALSFGPPRGSLPASASQPSSGRLYGPSLFPMALNKVGEVHGLVEVPIIAAGGIHEPTQIEAMLAAGAAAVQLDLALWLEPDRLLEAEYLSH